MNDLNLVTEVWDEMKHYINTVDRPEAAETIVSILIDNDIDADDILEAFGKDSEIKRALMHYLKDHEVEDDVDDEELYDDDYDEDDEDDDY